MEPTKIYVNCIKVFLITICTPPITWVRLCYTIRLNEWSECEISIYYSEIMKIIMNKFNHRTR